MAVDAAADLMGLGADRPGDPVWHRSDPVRRRHEEGRVTDSYRPFHGILPGKWLYIVGGLNLTALVIGLIFVATGTFG